MRRASRTTVQVLTLTRTEALRLTKLELWECERLILSDADVLVRGALLELQRDGGADMHVAIFPAIAGELRAPEGPLSHERDGIFTRYRLALPKREVRLRLTRFSDASLSVAIPAGSFDGLADIMLAIRYRGDVGHASIAGELVSDNFANGEPWEIDLRRFEGRLTLTVGERKSEHADRDWYR